MYVFFDYFLAPCTLLCLGESLPITSYWITETDAAEIQCVLCGEQGLIAKSKCQFKMP